jgi:hypothetical protein
MGQTPTIRDRGAAGRVSFPKKSRQAPDQSAVDVALTRNRKWPMLVPVPNLGRRRILGIALAKEACYKDYNSIAL